MATPTDKHPSIDEFLTDTFGVDRKATITNDKCVTCTKPNTNFRNEISRKEYRISGLCQDCQDSVFGKD